MNNPWTRVDVALPPAGEVVETKVDDEKGVRNVQRMIRRGGLWFTRDGLYTYYSPTHWRRRIREPWELDI